MKIKVSEATLLQLNYLVAKCEGWDSLRRNPHRFANFLIMSQDDENLRLEDYTPSTDWAQGGPIIEREIARLKDLGDEGWEACGYGFTAIGPTPLIASMRCFIISKLGDDVDVPEDLK